MRESERQKVNYDYESLKRKGWQLVVRERERYIYREEREREEEQEHEEVVGERRRS